MFYRKASVRKAYFLKPLSTMLYIFCLNPITELDAIDFVKNDFHADSYMVVFIFYAHNFFEIFSQRTLFFYLLTT